MTSSMYQSRTGGPCWPLLQWYQLSVSQAWVVVTGAGQLISSTQGHKQGINAVSCLPTSQGGLALSAGKDHTIRLWSAPAMQATSSGDAQAPTCLAVYKGHKDAVEDVAASPSGSAFCSGAWDGNVHIWRTGTLLLCCFLGKCSAASVVACSCM